MGAHDSAKQVNRFLNIPTILLASVFLLPSLIPSLFGWLSGLLAIPVYCLLVWYGSEKGTVFIRNGALLGVASAIVLNQFFGMLFSLTLVPLGYSLKRSAEIGDDEIRTGLKGVIVLGLSWLVFWTVYGIVQDVNPYSHLLQILETDFIQLFEILSRNADVPLKTQQQLGRLTSELRIIIPMILPGILAGTLLLTVWINMLGCITLLEVLKPEAVTWKKYNEWRLPDRIVWLPIISGFAWVFGSGVIQNAGISLIVVSTLLYFFQGLAVLIFFMAKWKIPLYLRILIYALLIFQSYGLLFVSLGGIADVWIDFRHRYSEDDQVDN